VTDKDYCGLVPRRNTFGLLRKKKKNKLTFLKIFDIIFIEKKKREEKKTRYVNVYK